MAGRIPRLSTTLKRALLRLGVTPQSPRYRAVFAAVGALAKADELPGPGDSETTFHPGRVHVRRVAGHNLWILYRFDAAHLDVLTVRDEPPMPSDEP